MANLIVIAIVLIIVGVAINYIVKAKKSGTKCIGCPAGGNCSGKTYGHSDCGCGCHSDAKQENSK
jgi:hypothetical protein